MNTISYRSERSSPASDRLVEPEKPSIFSFIMSVLHDSRRHQASRILRQYEHLVVLAAKREPQE